MCFFLCLNDTATTEIYTYCHTLSLHDDLPFYPVRQPLCGDAAGGRGDGQHCGPAAGLAGGPPGQPVAAPDGLTVCAVDWLRSEEHTSELQSLMRISYAVFCLKKKKLIKTQFIIKA